MVGFCHGGNMPASHHLDDYFRQAGHLEMIMVKMVNIKMMVERDDDEDPPDQAILVEIKPYRLNAEQQVGLEKSFICSVWTSLRKCYLAPCGHHCYIV